MNEKDYNSQAELLIKIIDIAIDCFKKSPPKEFEDSHIKHAISTYLSFKNNVINSEPRFKNISSLNQTKQDVLIYFQEGKGNTVDCFWEAIEANKIDIKRTNNKVEKILKRGRIKNDIEYDDIIDLYNSYINTLSQEEISKINNMISDFKSNK